MSNLFSAKSIVLICSFSFIILFYLIGGLDIIYNIELPTLALPEIKNPFALNNRENENCKIAEQFHNQYWQKNCSNQPTIQNLKDKLIESSNEYNNCDSRCQTSRNMIESLSDCHEMIKIWEENISWTIRNELAQKILNTCDI